ncbi:MAG: GTPase Era [Anaerolineae bacterium]|nr:GTPase Era [Anaerolineae bacterium]
MAISTPSVDGQDYITDHPPKRSVEALCIIRKRPRFTLERPDLELLISEELPEDHRSGFVAVLGKPNVGKSTLINAFVGQKIAIISPKPQTTRRRLRGILTLPQAQIIFIDTPGIHFPKHKLGEYMVETATRALEDIDLVLFMVDLSQLPTPEDEQIAKLLTPRDHTKRQRPAPVILVLNKVDLLRPEKEEAHREAYLALGEFQEWLFLSATRGDNRERLLEMIIEYLPLGPRYYPPDQVTDQEVRFMAAELVREQALAFLHQEVPHSVAAVVEEFEERREDLTYISATIYVERASQKGIVLGQEGEMLKRIGSAARKEIEALLGKRVYLELWVKVSKKWRQDEGALRRLGYVLPKNE